MIIILLLFIYEVHLYFYDIRLLYAKCQVDNLTTCYILLDYCT